MSAPMAREDHGNLTSGGAAAADLQEGNGHSSHESQHPEMQQHWQEQMHQHFRSEILRLQAGGGQQIAAGLLGVQDGESLNDFELARQLASRPATPRGVAAPSDAMNDGPSIPLPHAPGDHQPGSPDTFSGVSSPSTIATPMPNCQAVYIDAHPASHVDESHQHKTSEKVAALEKLTDQHKTPLGQPILTQGPEPPRSPNVRAPQMKENLAQPFNHENGEKASAVTKAQDREETSKKGCFACLFGNRNDRESISSPFMTIDAPSRGVESPTIFSTQKAALQAQTSPFSREILSDSAVEATTNGLLQSRQLVSPTKAQADVLKQPNQILRPAKPPHVQPQPTSSDSLAPSAHASEVSPTKKSEPQRHSGAVNQNVTTQGSMEKRKPVDQAHMQLGIVIAHYKVPYDTTKRMHVVYNMSPVGAAYRSGLIEIGDAIVGINGENVENLTHDVVKAKCEEAQQTSEILCLDLKRGRHEVQVNVHMLEAFYRDKEQPKGDVVHMGLGHPMASFPLMDPMMGMKLVQDMDLGGREIGKPFGGVPLFGDFKMPDVDLGEIGMRGGMAPPGSFDGYGSLQRMPDMGFEGFGISGFMNKGRQMDTQAFIPKFSGMGIDAGMDAGSLFGGLEPKMLDIYLRDFGMGAGGDFPVGQHGAHPLRQSSSLLQQHLQQRAFVPSAAAFDSQLTGSNIVPTINEKPTLSMSSRRHQSQILKPSSPRRTEGGSSMLMDSGSRWTSTQV